MWIVRVIVYGTTVMYFSGYLEDDNLSLELTEDGMFATQFNLVNASYVAQILSLNPLYTEVTLEDA